ncbi:helix-turn-helix transcriptional regulator [Micrococcus lylae]|nr:WYL domain-containing protein [Micrococcus lylae]
MTSTPGERERRTSERVIALLMLLIHTRHGYTTAQIRRHVEGYAELGDEAFEKAFQRDRALLEDIGVPLSLEQPEDADARHVVDASALLLPEIHFSGAERRALLHAREVWSETRLQTEVMRAVGLLVDPGSAGEADDGLGLPRVVQRLTPNLEVFLDAAVEQRVLAFGYRTAAGAVSPQGRPRRVRIWSALEIGGAWYAAGWDLDRQGERLFRVSRVIGRPEELPGTGSDAPARPADWNPVEIRDRLLGQGEGLRDRVRLWVAPGRGHSVRLRGQAVTPTAQDGAAPGEGWELWETDRPAHDGLVQLCGGLMGVVQPSAADPDVVAEVLAAWRRVAEVHDGAPPPHPELAKPRQSRYRQGQRERVSRLLDIVGLANRAGGITKVELADRLELSPKALDADLRDLQYCGLPERLFPGWLFDVDAESDVVEVRQAVDLPAPIRLSLPEAHRLSAALDTVAQMPHADDEVAPAAVTAAARIRQVLADVGHTGATTSVRPSTGGTDDPGDAAAVVPSAADGGGAGGHEPPATPVTSFWDVHADQDTVRVLMDAVARHRVVRLRYHALHSDRTTEREVEPVQLVQSGVVLYLQGHCRTAGAMRTFRVERISAVEPTGEIAKARRRPKKTMLTPVDTTLEAVLAWHHRIRDLADDYAPRLEAQDADGRRLTRLGLLSEDAAIALAGMHAGDVEVLEPAELRQAVRDRALAALRRLETAVRL